MKKIERLVAFDFDGTIMNTPMPDEGKSMWEKFHGKKFMYKGWWSKPESLDLNCLKIYPFPNVLNRFENAKSNTNTYVIILTSRMDKLRPNVQAILDVYNIRVDKLDMKYCNKTKGEKILDYVDELPNLTEICVYDDRESDIASYQSIVDMLPKKIKFNIYMVNNDNIILMNPSKSFLYRIFRGFKKLF